MRSATAACRVDHFLGECTAFWIPEVVLMDIFPKCGRIPAFSQLVCLKSYRILYEFLAHIEYLVYRNKLHTLSKTEETVPKAPQKNRNTETLFWEDEAKNLGFFMVFPKK